MTKKYFPFLEILKIQENVFCKQKTNSILVLPISMPLLDHANYWDTYFNLLCVFKKLLSAESQTRSNFVTEDFTQTLDGDMFRLLMVFYTQKNLHMI